MATALSPPRYEANDLRIFDYNGSRAFTLFTFDELSRPAFYETPKAD
jgi:hypothetical protein